MAEGRYRLEGPTTGEQRRRRSTDVLAARQREDPCRLICSTRTMRCGEVTEADADGRREVVLTGWVHRRRDLGQLIFVELRDGPGSCSSCSTPRRRRRRTRRPRACAPSTWSACAAASCGARRPTPTIPPARSRSARRELVVHNRAETVPFPVDDETEANEEARLTHRYVDLRRPSCSSALRTAPPPGHGGATRARRRGVHRGRDADAHALDARGRARLPRAEPRPPGALLRAAAVAAAVQAAPDGRRLRPLLPVRALLPRRGPARRPPARVHADRHRDVVRHAGGRSTR